MAASSVSCPFPAASPPPFLPPAPPFRPLPLPLALRPCHASSLHARRLPRSIAVILPQAVRGDGGGAADREEGREEAARGEEAPEVEGEGPGEASEEEAPPLEIAAGESMDQDQDQDQDEDEDDLQEMLKNSDWRAFRARLLQKSGANMVPSVAPPSSASMDSSSSSSSSSPGLDLWAHPLSQPEQGCLVIANPTAFLTRQQYFHQAVIFLFYHSKEGSAGLILNRPTEYNLGQLAGFEDLLPDFASCPLYMGGDVGANALHVIHGAVGLKDTLEIIPGVYMGGLKSMKSSVQNGESSASDYRWFVRYAGWGPGQLEREVAMGVWYLASSSKDVILKHCIRLPKPLWREVLEYMGGPYVDISRRAYGEI